MFTSFFFIAQRQNADEEVTQGGGMERGDRGLRHRFISLLGRQVSAGEKRVEEVGRGQEVMEKRRNSW